MVSAVRLRVLSSGSSLRAPLSPSRVRQIAVLALVIGLATGVGVAAAAPKGHDSHRGIRTYSTRGTSPLRTALFDPYAFASLQQPTAFAMTRAAGATYVRIVARWSTLAPAAPWQGWVASDPTVGYSWSWLDGTVASAEADGLTPILDIGGPPGWALATPGKGASAGTPSIPALKDFATALATHYDGLNGAPKVDVFQVWNEPNLSLDLWPVKPAVYRSMVNAVAQAVRAVNPSSTIVAGDLDPFENKTKRFNTMAPLAFMRSLLCVSKGLHPHATCKTRTDFDVWSHHPYTFDGPFGRAKRADDVSLGDLPKMRALLRAAVRLHHVASVHPVQFWVTEFSWDTNPPRKHAAPVALEARWTAESLYQMWRSGVSLVTWFLLQDRPSPSPYQSGLYFHSKSLTHARAKPMRTAFRFPFVAYLGRGTVSIWGRDATSSKKLVTIQRRIGAHGGWRKVALVRSNRYGIFKATLKLAATANDWFRAVAPGSGTSLAFSLAVPKHQRYGPWGN